MLRSTAASAINHGMECVYDKKTDRHYQGRSTGHLKFFQAQLG